MKMAILIADSGGTHTDWCFINQNGERYYFNTVSFHPSQWNEIFLNEFKDFWKDKPDMLKAKVYFYGAGCMSESNKKRIAEYFSEWNFIDVTILSDIEAACHAVLGDKKGSVAILGTGSVYCTYDGNRISTIQGGLGYILGDEGSGYHFGKMLLSDYMNGAFSQETRTILRERLGDRSEILKKVYGEQGKDYISSLSKITSDLKVVNSDILLLHFQNINLFVKKYLLGNNLYGRNISFVGSYAYFNKDLLTEILQQHNYKLKNVTQYPINSLTDYIEKMTL